MPEQTKREIALEKQIAKLENRIQTVSGYIDEIMKRLALLTVLQSTHRQKNALIAECVRYMDTVRRILDVRDTHDLDEIPF